MIPVAHSGEPKGEDTRRWTIYACDCGAVQDEPGECPNRSEHLGWVTHLSPVAVVPASALAQALEEKARAEEALRECARLSGADLSDGFPTWPPLHEFAVQEVKRLREDADEVVSGGTESA